MGRSLDLAKRTAILDAARKIIVRDGYESAKVSDIASEAGIASGTLYLYFKSKEALVAAIGEDFYVRLSDQFDLIVKKFRGPDGVTILINWAIQIAEQEKDVLTMGGEGVPSTRQISAGRSTFVKKLSKSLKSLMDRGILRQYDEPEILAEFVFNIIRQIVWACSAYDEGSIDRLKNTSIQMLRHALFDDSMLAAERLLARRKL